MGGGFVDFGLPIRIKETRPRAKWLFLSRILRREALGPKWRVSFCPGCQAFLSGEALRHSGGAAYRTRSELAIDEMENSAEEIESMPTFVKEAGCGPHVGGPTERLGRRGSALRTNGALLSHGSILRSFSPGRFAAHRAGFS